MTSRGCLARLCIHLRCCCSMLRACIAQDRCSLGLCPQQAQRACWHRRGTRSSSSSSIANSRRQVPSTSSCRSSTESLNTQSACSKHVTECRYKREGEREKQDRKCASNTMHAFALCLDAGLCSSLVACAWAAESCCADVLRRALRISSMASELPPCFK